MGRRYGRNQKRAHREEIDQLRAEMSINKNLHERTVFSMRVSQRRELEKAQEDALNAYLKAYPQLPDLLSEMTARVSNMLGEELKKHAKMIVDSGLMNARNAEMLALSARKIGNGDIAIHVQTTHLRYTLEGQIGIVDFNVIPHRFS